VPPDVSTSTATIGSPSPLPIVFCDVGARQNRSVACLRCSSLRPGPSSTTCTAIRSPSAYRTDTVTEVAPYLRALSISTSRAWSTAVVTARAFIGRGAGTRRKVTPRCSASGCQAVIRSAATASASTVSRPKLPRSALARASRLSRTSLSRSVSCSAVRPSSPGTASLRSSTRSRNAVSGLRSWWLACDTNARCRSSTSDTVPTISLNAVASRRSSGGPPAAGTRAS
jgi:hypothetical protein